MVQNTFQEDREAFFATFLTRWGWLSFILGNIFYGYLILKYIDVIESFIVSRLYVLPNYMVDPVSWMIFGIFSSILGFIILLIVEKIVLLTGIKNKHIFR